MAGAQQGSKTEFAVKLVLVFFISLLSFSVGTFVGKQVSDSERRQAELKGEQGGRDVASVDGGHDSHAKEDESLSEEEIASLTNEFIESEKRKIASHGPNGTPEGASEHGHAPVEKKESAATKAEPKGHGEQAAGYKKMKGGEAADKVAHSEPLSGEIKKERQPASVLPSVASSTIGKFTVQVASYATEEEAKNHSAQLKTKGWNAFYIPAEVSGRTWYRVSVGLFNSATSAKNFQEELKREANINSSIVQKIVR